MTTPKIYNNLCRDINNQKMDAYGLLVNTAHEMQVGQKRQFGIPLPPY